MQAVGVGVSSAAPASSCALARILPVALAIAAGVPPDGLVLKPWPEPKRFSSAGHDLDVERRHAELVGRRAARSAPSLPSASVVRLSTILPVGWTRRNTAR